MSETVLQVCTFAAQRVNLIGDTEQLSAQQGLTALNLLNNMLSDQAADGVDVGWYTQTSTTGTAPLQDADLYPVKMMLARVIATHYSLPLSPPLAAEIEKAEARLVKRLRPIPEANLTELPVPQGPWNRAGFW
jgi:hypothetical protein